MKTKVFLRKENEFKEVKITDPAKPEIRDEILKKWQNIINIITSIIGVSAGLIMKIIPEKMEVVLKSQNEDNPYKVGANDSLGHGLYCETVIGHNKELYIKNALQDEDWKDNPDIDLDMISYFGLPIKWTDNEIFGTICILDEKIMDLDEKHQKLLEEFRDVIEDDLNLLIKQQEFKNFFDVNLDLLCIADTDGNFIKVNNAWSDLLGYSKDDLEKMRFLDFVHPDDLESTLSEIENLKNDQKAIKFINRYKDKNGKYHYIEWNSKLKGANIYAAARDITEKVVKNERLKQQKDRLNFIIEGTDAATWEWDIQTGKTVFSDRWAEMLGYSLDELSPTTVDTWVGLIHPDDLKRAERVLEEHFRGEIEQYSIEVRMMHKNGSWVWINGRGRIVSWTKANNPHKMFGIHIDITERKKKEKKITKAKKMLEDLADQAPGTLYQYQLFPDGSSRFPYASEGIYEIYEVTPEKVVNDASKVFQRIHPEDYQKVVDAIQKSAETLAIWHDRYRVILPKQGEKWVEGRAKPEKMEDGSVIWHGNIREITDEKRKEENLQLNEEKFRGYFESSPTGIFITDEKGQYIDVNQSACRLLGYNKNELIGKNILDIASSSDKNDHLQKFKELQETGNLRVEIKLMTKDKESKFVRLNANKLDSGKNLGFVEDLTELNREHDKTNKILETAIDGFFMADEQGEIINMNQAFEDILGYSRDEIIGKKIPYFEERENKYEVKEHIRHIKANGSDRFETIYKNKAGEKINMEVSVTYLNLDNQSDLFFAFVKDITERKKRQREIREIKERLELAVEGGNIGIWDWNIKTGKTYFNKNWFNMIGYREGELDYNVKSWEDLIHPDDKSNIKREISKFLDGKVNRYLTEHRVKTKNGNYKWIKDIGKVIHTDEKGKPIRAVGIHLDVDKEKRSKKQVEYLSYHDSLTELYNYRYLMEEISRISNSRNYPISIVVGDLDRLKFINDNFGHKMGDEYIKKAAEILKKCFRNEDVVSRIGGDEFAVILPNTNNNEAQKIISRVRNQFEIIKEKNKKFNFFNISLGVSTIENSSMSFEEGYRMADKKMYKDKKEH